MPTSLLLSPYSHASQAPAENTAFTFTGTNGDPWPSPWVSSPGGTGALTDIQANRGRMVTASAANTYQASRAFYGSTSYGDFDFVGRLALANPIVTQYCAVAIHGDTWWSTFDYPTNGYNFQCRPGAGQVAIMESTAGAWSDIATAAKTFTAGTDVWVKVSVAGARIRGRVWNVGAAEPAAWDVDLTDATSPFLTGKWGLTTASSGASVTCYWDDLTFTPISSTGPYSHVGADTVLLTDALSSTVGGGGTPVQWDTAASVLWDNSTAVSWG